MPNVISCAKQFLKSQIFRNFCRLPGNWQFIDGDGETFTQAIRKIRTHIISRDDEKDGLNLGLV